MPNPGGTVGFQNRSGVGSNLVSFQSGGVRIPSQLVSFHCSVPRAAGSKVAFQNQSLAITGVGGSVAFQSQSTAVSTRRRTFVIEF